jgi:hypothetical protein
MFIISLRPSSNIAGYYLQVGHERFLLGPSNLKHIVSHSTLWILRYMSSVADKTMQLILSPYADALLNEITKNMQMTWKGFSCCILILGKCKYCLWYIMTLQDVGDLMVTRTNIWFQICVTWRQGLTQVNALVVPAVQNYLPWTGSHSLTQSFRLHTTTTTTTPTNWAVSLPLKG